MRGITTPLFRAAGTQHLSLRGPNHHMQGSDPALHPTSFSSTEPGPLPLLLPGRPFEAPRKLTTSEASAPFQLQPYLTELLAASNERRGLKEWGEVGEGVRLSKFKLKTDPKEIIRLLEEADAICRQKQWCLVAEAYKMCVYTGFGSLKTIFFSLKSHSWNGRSHHSHLLVSFPPVSGVIPARGGVCMGFH